MFCVYWKVFVRLCVCETSLGAHFRALDQTCEDVFSCNDFGSSENVPYVSFCESSQQYKNLYVCVWAVWHLPQCAIAMG